MRIASSVLLRWRAVVQAPVLGLHHFGHGLALLMCALLWLFAQQAEPLPIAQWKGVDVLGEGGLVLMIGVWLAQVRASRPAGRVTSWLCLGLAAMLLGAWVDLLDEFWHLPKSVLWDNWLESTLMPLGAGLLTWGLHLWRQEQLAMNQQWLRRERLFREHRSLDGVTQLGDASYMASQIAMERQLQRPGTLVMLAWQGFDGVARQHGLGEAERMLQAAGQLLLLNLRADDLLCRYAADRFVLLLPATTGAAAEALAADLQVALAAFAYPVRDGAVRIKLPVLMTCCGTSDGPAQTPEQLLLQLLERL